MIYQLLLLFMFYQTLTGSMHDYDNYALERFPKSLACDFIHSSSILEVTCPSEITLDNIDISGIDPLTIGSIEYLSVKGNDNSRGPLTAIPSNVCQFNKLKNVDLSFNRIQNPDFESSVPCSPELQYLSLSDNFLTRIPIDWLNQTTKLETIDLSRNSLTDLCYNAFANPSNLRHLNVSHNFLSTIELWTIQFQQNVDYRANRIREFSNKNNVDLSQHQWSTIPKFDTSGNPQIHFDDTIFAMYNRCAEVHNILNLNTTYEPTLTRAVLAILGDLSNPQHFYIKCTCDQFYFYQAAFAAQHSLGTVFFATWRCLNDTVTFIQRCNNRSSANFADVVPRFCKIDSSEPGNVPVYSPPLAVCQPLATSSTQHSTFSTTQRPTTTSPPPLPPEEIKDQLQNISVLNNSTVNSFATLVNTAGRNPDPTDEHTVQTFQKIINLIEDLIRTPNTTLNSINDAVALMTTTKDKPIYHLSQFALDNSLITYSNTPDHLNSTASISINEIYLNQSLAANDFYSFFMLPSSIFQYAQTERYIEIVSPIVGAHLPDQNVIRVEMSFQDKNVTRASRNYSCVFWEKDRWNSSGCVYSYKADTNRHYCSCNHLTSFGLIFTPDGILRETFLPTILTSCLSIVGISISIILSVYQQKKSTPIERSYHLSIVKILALSSTLILFILVTILLISNYRLDAIYRPYSTFCSSSKRNLVLTVYFFVILTFIVKTLLGIYYFFAVFFQLESLLKDISTRWFLTSLISIFIIAFIPTIVASALEHRSNNIILSRNDVCWFDGKYVSKFITIPVSIIIGMNVLILICAGVGLIFYILFTRADRATGKRLMTGALIWIASCISLGILWAIGPLLNAFVNQNGQSSSKASQGVQWVFALLTGLEGVWILIVSILFYVRQRPRLLEGTSSSKNKKMWSQIDDLGNIRIFSNN